MTVYEIRSEDNGWAPIGYTLAESEDEALESYGVPADGYAAVPCE